MTTREIATLLGAEIEGNPDCEITGANALELATESELAFVENAKAQKLAEASRAGCLIVPSDAPANGRTQIRVPQPRSAFARVLRNLYPPARPQPGVDRTAVVAASAVLGEGVSIGPHSIVGENVRLGARCVVFEGVSIGEGASLGNDCRLYPGVTVYHGVSIGHRVTLHAGAVIGSDGFGYAFEGGRFEKFPQVGIVEIGDDVEIGANACVDRAALGATVIGEGTKLDNLVHIGHNCRLGRHVVIAAQTGLSGGVVVEDYVVMGGQVGISEKAHLGKQAVIGAQCGILPFKKIRPGETVWGTPSRPHKEHLEKLALIGRLPKFFEEFEALRKRVAELEAS